MFVLLTLLGTLYFVSKIDFRLILAGVYCCWKSGELEQYGEELWLRNHPGKLLKYHLLWSNFKFISFLHHDFLKPRCPPLFLKQCYKLLFLLYVFNPVIHASYVTSHMFIWVWKSSASSDLILLQCFCIFRINEIFIPDSIAL